MSWPEAMTDEEADEVCRQVRDLLSVIRRMQVEPLRPVSSRTAAYCPPEARYDYTGRESA